MGCDRAEFVRRYAVAHLSWRELTVTLLAALIGAAALCGAFAMVRHWML
jgi:hypothetical protein